MSKLFINDRISKGSWSLEKFEISVLILFLFESRAFLLAFLKLIHFFLRSIVIQSIYIYPSDKTLFNEKIFPNRRER